MARRSDTQLVTITGPGGQALHGLVEGPVGPGTKVVVMGHSGLMGRHGDHRMHIRLSRRLLAAGFAVSRFDPHGLGISEGELPALAQRDLFGLIETGELAPDMLAWLAMLKERYGAERFALNGACGAAMTCLLTAEQDPQVEEVIGVSLPVMLDGSEPIQLNEHFLRAFQTLAARRQRLLMVYATTDVFWTSYCQLFAEPHAPTLERAATSVELMTLNEGNHLFTLREWQTAIDDKVLGWIRP